MTATNGIASMTHSACEENVHEDDWDPELNDLDEFESLLANKLRQHLRAEPASCFDAEKAHITYAPSSHTSILPGSQVSNSPSFSVIDDDLRLAPNDERVSNGGLDSVS